MAVVVRPTVSPEQVLEEAGAFLKGDPIRHNLVLTLLRVRTAHPEPGRYWLVEAEGDVSGVVFQSPLHFMATLTPMPAQAVFAVVEAMVQGGVELPGVNAEAATAAHFAGHWAEQTKSPVRPLQAQRIYELHRLVAPRPAAGRLRQAGSEDRDLLVDWLRAFQAEAGDPFGEPARIVERRLANGQLWLWDHQTPAAMAGVSSPEAGVVRVGPVYTPPERRNRGYASALVAGVSADAQARGERCILFTDLANPTSNSIYRSLGYRAVVEALRYEFG